MCFKVTMEKKKKQTEDLVDGFKAEETEILWKKKKAMEEMDDGFEEDEEI